LVVAGGAGGGSDAGGGGGAGGFRCTVDNTGGGGALESALSLTSGTSYTVTIGAGGRWRWRSWHKCLLQLRGGAGGLLSNFNYRVIGYLCWWRRR
jgi:hypothetical protein